jgi:hypothetical protein
MAMLYRAIACGILIGALGAPAGAQRALTIEQQNALGVLDGLVEQARSIADDATRIRIQARIADALWARDRARAERIYRRLYDDIEDLDESIVDPASAPVGARLELRVEIFSSLYRLDPAFANQLARGLDDDPEFYDGAGLPYETLSDRSATLMGAATAVAARDPQLAADLGRESIRTGVPIEFAGLLEAIARSNRPLADDLAGEAAAAAARAGTSPVDVWGVATYAFPELRLTPDDAAASPAAAELKRRVLEAAYSVTTRYVAALAEETAGRNPAVDEPDPVSVYEGQGLLLSYGLARQLAPFFDVHAQGIATSYRVLLAQIESAAPPGLHERVGPSAAAGDTPEALAARAADTTDRAARNALYVRAAVLALERDGYDAAKGFVAKIEDDAARAAALGPIAERAARLAVANRRFDDARRIALDVSDLAARGRLYGDIARALAAAGKRPQALELLEEAQTALLKDGAVMTRAKAEALVRVANAFAALDAVRGFEVMDVAVDAVNKGLARVEPQKGRNPGTLFLLAELDPSPGVEELARTDYFRSLALAQSLDDRALSILAQIGAVRGAMRATAAPATKPEPPARRAKAKPTAPAKAPAVKPAAQPQ